MKKIQFSLIVALLSFVMVGCDDEDDVKSIDLTLFPGTWVVVDNGSQELFDRSCMLDVTSSQIHEGYGGYQGYITTYFLTAAGTPKHDRVFTWSIREVDNQQPLLDVVYQGELDDDDLWTCNYLYKVVKLTDTHMWWQVNTNADNNTIKFRRRNDIQIE